MLKDHSSEPRTSYGVIAIDTACLVIALLSAAVQVATSLQKSALPLAFYSGLLATLACVAVAAIGIALEWRRSRVAVWINVGWPLLALIVAPVTILIEIHGETAPSKAIGFIVASSALPFALLFALMAFLYRSALLPDRRTSDANASTPLGEQSVVSFETNRNAVLGKLALWMSPLLVLYPVVLLFLLRGNYLSKESAAGFELLLFVVGCLTVISLAFAFRNKGAAKKLAVSLSALALALNFTLLGLISLSV